MHKNRGIDTGRFGTVKESLGDFVLGGVTCQSPRDTILPKLAAQLWKSCVVLLNYPMPLMLDSPSTGAYHTRTESFSHFPAHLNLSCVKKQNKKNKPKSNPPLLSVAWVNLNYLKHQMLKSTTNQGAADVSLQGLISWSPFTKRSFNRSSSSSHSRRCTH